MEIKSPVLVHWVTKEKEGNDRRQKFSYPGPLPSLEGESRVSRNISSKQISKVLVILMDEIKPFLIPWKTSRAVLGISNSSKFWWRTYGLIQKTKQQKKTSSRAKLLISK